MRVHFVAVCGTGMGSLAGLFQAAGHEVSGSDVAYDPPMGPALERWGVRCLHGFDATHVTQGPRPDLVVIGNVCRRDNPEARAAIDGGYPYTDMAHALGDHVLASASPLVVAGTHGKTTTTALAATLLDQTGKEPGFLIGGLPRNFTQSFRLPGKRKLADPRPTDVPVRKAPFVVEGDEYDTAFFEKTPKCWHYRADVAILGNIEHDHVDIYPDLDSYLAAFRGLLARLPETGLLVAAAADPLVRRVVAESPPACPIAWFAVDGDETGAIVPEWLAFPGPEDASGQSFDLFAGGMKAGRFGLRVPGRHNLRNALAALAAVAQGYGVPLAALRDALPAFQGVARRQDLLGSPDDVLVYDDFAHHPTAVAETLRALRRKHPNRPLIAVFEPRSATACRAMHQEAYAQAFGEASQVLLAPLGRSIAASEALDLGRLAAELTQQGTPAQALRSLDELHDAIAALALPGSTVVLLSNGAFGGLPNRVVSTLAGRAELRG